MLAADTGAEPAVLVAAEQKAADDALVDLAAFSANGDALDVVQEGDVAVATIAGDAAMLHVELSGDAALDGGVLISGDGEVAFSLGAAQPYGGFSGQISEIANAKTTEIAQLGAVL